MSDRRRWLAVLVVIAVVLVLAAPLWAGYFGPATATYAATWRPWRTGLTVEENTASAMQRTSAEAWYVVEYGDPWPGKAAGAGKQIRFVSVERAHPLLPWMVTESGTGP
ncbi:MAG: hypothetical protein Q7W51_07715 [Coriobacteriia bacterium]|nr:hypothetical protein [Coriobacteriia bacterium]